MSKKKIKKAIVVLFTFVFMIGIITMSGDAATSIGYCEQTIYVNNTSAYQAYQADVYYIGGITGYFTWLRLKSANVPFTTGSTKTVTTDFVSKLLEMTTYNENKGYTMWTKPEAYALGKGYGYMSGFSFNASSLSSTQKTKTITSNLSTGQYNIAPCLALNKMQWQKNTYTQTYGNPMTHTTTQSSYFYLRTSTAVNTVLIYSANGTSGWQVK
jgi:hypothetical protein